MTIAKEMRANFRPNPAAVHAAAKVTRGRDGSTHTRHQVHPASM
jgi:hypothetical protein